MTDLFIRVTDDGHYQPHRTVNGRYRLDVGPAFERPKDAVAFCNAYPAMQGTGESEHLTLPTPSGDDQTVPPVAVGRLRGSPVGVVTSPGRG